MHMVWRSLIHCLLYLCVCVLISTQGKIKNVSKFPFVSLLRIHTENCTGIILSRNCITAASDCFSPKWKGNSLAYAPLQPRINVKTVQVRKIKNLGLHEVFEYDAVHVIMLLTVDQPFRFQDTLKPITLSYYYAWAAARKRQCQAITFVKGDLTVKEVEVQNTTKCLQDSGYGLLSTSVCVCTSGEVSDPLRRDSAIICGGGLLGLSTDITASERPGKNICSSTQALVYVFMPYFADMISHRILVEQFEDIHGEKCLTNWVRRERLDKRSTYLLCSFCVLMSLLYRSTF